MTSPHDPYAEVGANPGDPLAMLPGTELPDYNTMLPVMVSYLVPVGLRGLLAACMAAALMSCMAAALNSCATLISMDVVKRVRPETSDARTVTIGRITTGGIVTNYPDRALSLRP